MKKILHIDDDKNFIDLIRLLLLGKPYQVIGETQGANTMRRVLEHKPDIILLDMMIPDKSGYEILEQLKQNPETREIPVIALSVSSERERSLQAGATVHITKPMKEDRLIKIIDELTVTAQ
ncbi:MAG: response regulator [Candidatus Zhuqueibacterota bacterium]